MENENMPPGRSSDLRKRAVEMLRNDPRALATLPAEDIEYLAHELSVYQIELEMQNEELRMAQAELMRSRAEYSELYDFAPMGYLTVSTKGIIEKLNLTAAAMLGKERAYLVRQSFSKFVVTEDMGIYYQHRRKVLQAQEPRECEFRIKREDGSVFWAHLRCSPVTDESGQVTKLLSVITEITERKRAEAGREQFMHTIWAKNEELKSVVDITSHDLHGPLVNIAGFSRILAETCTGLRRLLDDPSIEPALKQKLLLLFDHDIPEDLAFINASTDKMKSLLNGLLQVSRIGIATVAIERLDMNAMLNMIVKNAQFKINECGGSVLIDDLPDCLGDITMVNQVFSNLIDNALKYQDPARKLKIHVWGQTENGMCTYCVKDNGMGIDPDHQERVFEIFHRLNPKDGAGGEGLGLSIVMRIVNRLNGRVRVESEAGKGSRFFVSLPAVNSLPSAAM